MYQPAMMNNHSRFDRSYIHEAKYETQNREALEQNLKIYHSDFKRSLNNGWNKMKDSVLQNLPNILDCLLYNYQDTHRFGLGDDLKKSGSLTDQSVHDWSRENSSLHNRTDSREKDKTDIGFLKMVANTFGLFGGSSPSSNQNKANDGTNFSQDSYQIKAYELLSPTENVSAFHAIAERTSNTFLNLEARYLPAHLAFIVWGGQRTEERDRFMKLLRKQTQMNDRHMCLQVDAWEYFTFRFLHALTNLGLEVA